MTRNLTPREWLLLAILAVLLLVSSYLMFFYLPMSTERDNLQRDIESSRLELEVAQIQVENKQRMEQELAQIFAQNPNPIGLAHYDNVQAVMLELHSILQAADDYALSFSTVDASQKIVRRSISLNFTSGSYASARQILQRLNDSAYRCMLESLSININPNRNRANSVAVNGVIVFFEYQ